MKQLHCSVLHCISALSSVEEITTRMCTLHYKLLLQDHSFVGLCWRCGGVTTITEKPCYKGECIMKDKYIFSNGCPFCDGQYGDNWMTINNNQHSEVVLGKGETLVFEEGQLKSYIFEQDVKDEALRDQALNNLEFGLAEMGLI